MKFLNFIKKLLVGNIIKTLQLGGDPKKVAGGFAIGWLIGFTPFVGFQFLISLGLAGIFKVNKVAAVLAVFNTNLFTGIFIFIFNFKVGTFLLGVQPEFVFPDTVDYLFIKTIAGAGTDVLLSLLLGGIVNGIPTAILIYHILLFFLNKKSLKTVQGNCERIAFQ
jgi:uncharacterized protein